MIRRRERPSMESFSSSEYQDGLQAVDDFPLPAEHFVGQHLIQQIPLQIMKHLSRINLLQIPGMMTWVAASRELCCTKLRTLISSWLSAGHCEDRQGLAQVPTILLACSHGVLLP